MRSATPCKVPNSCRPKSSIVGYEQTARPMWSFLGKIRLCPALAFVRSSSEASNESALFVVTAWTDRAQHSP